MTRDPRAVLRDAGLRPKKSFGQNFPVANAIAVSIAEACVHDDEVGRARVVEIGAGTGVLLQRFGRFYLATSVVWDSFRAAGDALAVIVLGLPVLAALARVKSRLTFTVSGPGGGDGARSSSDGAVPSASGAGLAAQPPTPTRSGLLPGSGAQ